MSKLRVIWIDDERNPKGFGRFKWWCNYVPEEFKNLVYKLPIGEEVEVVWFKSYDEWLKWCTEVWHNEKEEEHINCFCLDHDLASYDETGKEKTGVDIAYDICDECTINGRVLPYYECHSSNPAGKENILSVFKTYEKVYG